VLGAAVVGADVGFLLGALLEGVVTGAVECVIAGAAAEDDVFGVGFFAADLDGDTLAVGVVGAGIDGAVMVGVAVDVLATATPATCVL
jgi:hypothetical protein